MKKHLKNKTRLLLDFYNFELKIRKKETLKKQKKSSHFK